MDDRSYNCVMKMFAESVVHPSAMQSLDTAATGCSPLLTAAGSQTN